MNFIDASPEYILFSPHVDFHKTLRGSLYKNPTECDLYMRWGISPSYHYLRRFSIIYGPQLFLDTFRFQDFHKYSRSSLSIHGLPQFDFRTFQIISGPQ